MTRWVSWLLTSVLVSGCNIRLPEGRYSCDNDNDCPSGWSCRADRLCYASAAAGGPVDAAADSGKVSVGEQQMFDAGSTRDGGQGADAGQPVTRDAGGSAACSASSPAYCEGDSPVLCSDGEWFRQPACSGTTPVCSLGSCVKLRLARGELGLAPLPAADAPYRLRQHGFGFVLQTCGETRSRAVCVTGSIHP